ncbi:MAG: CPBP family intramembrane glutamic endopeptidase [Phycisphaerae bacterium]|jgi:membrane protease YdiL (CAAX protease family)
MTGYYIFISVMNVAGIVLLVGWLAMTGFGTKALDRVEQRRNFMPYYLPFVVIFCWLSLYVVSSNLADSITSEMLGWQQKLATYAFFVAIEMIVIVFIIFSVRKYFENGLYGFGLRFKGIFRDIASAAAIFAAAWPLVFIALLIVLHLGRFFVGPDFQMERNEGLTVILEYQQWSLRFLMIFFATILTPIFEELVFRGLLQSYLRNIAYGPWASIFIASALFAVLHPVMHFPAIFVLSVSMGYAYEKSGSLVRSIFIHIFFNASTIAFALLGN